MTRSMPYEEEQWGPRDERNPFRVPLPMLSDEWLEITRWYPFSVRVLVTLNQKIEWHEAARTTSLESAQKIMEAIAITNQSKGFVVIHCRRLGKEGREGPVLYHPSQESLFAFLQGKGTLH
jgi:hypothetical protein